MTSRRQTKMKSPGSTSRGLFVRYFKSRPDIGFGKLLLDIALEPRSPFKPWEPRRVKKGFVVAVLFILVACAWFGYFSVGG